jgi:arabinogalactan oligomer / maltooligosaccharide transport system permease protein
MNSVEYYSLSGFQKFIFKIKAFFASLFLGFIAFFKYTPRNIGRFFTAIYGKLKFLAFVFKVGDSKTRLSFIFMGFSNLARGQIIKGLIYFISETAFVFYMIKSGAANFTGLRTLGTQTQHIEAVEGQVPVLVQGDNSMLMLLFGTLSVFIIAIFIYVYYMNITSAYNAQLTVKKGNKLPSFIEDSKSYFDSKFHVTLLTLPIIGIFLFTILPLAFMILIAFTNYDSSHQPPGNLFTWTGVSGFKSIFSTTGMLGQTFWPMLGWTMTWAVIATFSNYILGMLLAILINQKGIKFKGFFRTVFVLTIAIPAFVSLLVMRNMLDINGPINGLLKDWGLISSSIQFLTDVNLARVSVLVVNLWIGIPYTMLITTGILLNIPADLYEAAKVDGASPLAMYTKITLPYVLFVTTPYLITQFIGNINNFNVIYLLTGGAPGTLNYYQAGKTDLLVTWLYKLTTNTRDYSYAAAIGIIVFVISAVFSLITYRNTASYKNEEGFQ